jgi:hypothetical protein
VRAGYLFLHGGFEWLKPASKNIAKAHNGGHFALGTGHAPFFTISQFSSMVRIEIRAKI